MTELRKFWRDIRDSAVPEFKVERPKDNVIPWQQATSLMLQQLAVMRKLNG
jgi:hypothetical protein